MDPQASQQHPSPLSPVAVPAPRVAPPFETPKKVVEVHVRTDSFKEGIRNHTCLQCGLNPARPVARKFQYVPPWVYLGLLANIVVVLILYYIGRRTVDAKFGLCPDCDRAERRGRTLRSWSVIGIFAGPALGAVIGIPLASMFGDMAIAFGAGAGLVAGIAGIVAAHRKTRFDVIGTKLIDKKTGVTTLTAQPSFTRVLAEECPEAVPVR